MNMNTFEQRLDAIVTYAWEIWTNNGLGLDSEDREETAKTVKDVATNAYLDNMTDTAWLEATLARLMPQGM
jgi:hypothetical protein